MNDKPVSASPDGLGERLREAGDALERITYRPDIAFTEADRRTTFAASAKLRQAADRIDTLTEQVVALTTALNEKVQTILDGSRELVCPDCHGRGRQVLGEMWDAPYPQSGFEVLCPKCIGKGRFPVVDTEMSALRSENARLAEQVRGAEGRLQVIAELADYPFTMEAGTWDGPRFAKLLRDISALAALSIYSIIGATPEPTTPEEEARE